MSSAAGVMLGVRRAGWVLAARRAVHQLFDLLFEGLDLRRDRRQAVDQLVEDPMLGGVVLTVHSRVKRAVLLGVVLAVHGRVKRAVLLRVVLAVLLGVELPVDVRVELTMDHHHVLPVHLRLEDAVLVGVELAVDRGVELTVRGGVVLAVQFGIERPVDAGVVLAVHGRAVVAVRGGVKLPVLLGVVLAVVLGVVRAVLVGMEDPVDCGIEQMNARLEYFAHHLGSPLVGIERCPAGQLVRETCRRPQLADVWSLRSCGERAGRPASIQENTWTWACGQRSSSCLFASEPQILSGGRDGIHHRTHVWDYSAVSSHKVAPELLWSCFDDPSDTPRS